MVHRREELLVGLGEPHLLLQELHRFDGIHVRKVFAEHPRAVHHLARQEQILAARARGDHVDGRVDALIGQLAVELQLHVARALNSSKITSSIFEPVSMSAVAMIVSEPFSSVLRAAPKLALGLVQRISVDTAREYLPEAGCTEL